MERTTQTLNDSDFRNPHLENGGIECIQRTKPKPSIFYTHRTQQYERMLYTFMKMNA